MPYHQPERFFHWRFFHLRTPAWSSLFPPAIVAFGHESFAVREGEASPAFLTTKEVAELLRVKERKVYDLAAEGEIPCRRVTGKLLFPRLELEAWLTGSAGATKPAPQRPNVIAGSHDPLLDWAIRESGSGLATFFDGSLDGLDRIAAGEAAAAGMHVFEAARDDWNVNHVAAKLAGQPVVVVEFARRQQGLILAKGSEKDVQAPADLRGRKVVKRQPAAGAALLLHHLLKRDGLSAEDIDWLPGLARTETEAAASVAAGDAEAALGLQAMAKQFGLPFLALAEERFDLVADRRCWFEPPMQSLLAFCRTSGFAEKARCLGGYDVSGFGRVQWNGP